jgi:hypothetical protein
MQKKDQDAIRGQIVELKKFLIKTAQVAPRHFTDLPEGGWRHADPNRPPYIGMENDFDNDGFDDCA